ncbi:hypothetical protein J6590_106579, partial [Homalodisca vitripennis]
LATVPALVTRISNQTDFSATMWSDCTSCIGFSVTWFAYVLLWSHLSGTGLISLQQCGQTVHRV